MLRRFAPRNDDIPVGQSQLRWLRQAGTALIVFVFLFGTENHALDGEVLQQTYAAKVVVASNVGICDIVNASNAAAAAFSGINFFLGSVNGRWEVSRLVSTGDCVPR